MKQTNTNKIIFKNEQYETNFFLIFIFYAVSDDAC